MSLQYIPNYFGGLDLGNFSTPFIYDFNKDGKNEIIVGERFDNVNLLENIGSVTNPNFVIATDSLYKINLKMFATYPSGRAHLQIQTLRPNDVPKVVLSNGNGKLYVMGEVSTNYTQKMSIVTDSLNLDAGQFSFANGGFPFSMADLNGDSKPEIVVGTPQGGLFLYRNTSLSVGVNNYKLENSIQVFPNPANTFINIKSTNNDLICNVKLMDLNGRILTETSASNSIVNINLEGISKGIYFIKVQTGNNITTKKIVISR
jgi:hypothetical protein